jgi:uncharacterized FlaG/YvyC family protein
MNDNSISLIPERIEISTRRLEQPPRRPSPSEVKKTAETAEKEKPSELNQIRETNPTFSSVSAPTVTFTIDKTSGEQYIQVIDKVSGEVVRQIPPEELRRLSAVLEKLTGNVVDMVV